MRSVVAPGAGDAIGLAHGFAAAGARELYVADLDAIAGEPLQRDLLRAIGSVVPAILLDAGAADVDAAQRAVEAGASRVVVGLESLRSFDDLERIGAALGGERTVFSLDLRDGSPIGRVPGSPRAIAERAAAAGVRAMIVLDLARVGSGMGLDLGLLAELRRSLPAIELLAGGGVRDLDDLHRLAEVGCDGALVGTALHEGRIRLGPAWPAPQC